MELERTNKDLSGLESNVGRRVWAYIGHEKLGLSVNRVRFVN